MSLLQEFKKLAGLAPKLSSLAEMTKEPSLEQPPEDLIGTASEVLAKTDEMKLGLCSMPRGEPVKPEPEAPKTMSRKDQLKQMLKGKKTD